MAAQPQETSSSADQEWMGALHHLTEEGVLSAEAAAQVRDEHDRLAAQRLEARRGKRMAELIGYAGAMLTVLGVAFVASEVWDDLGESVRFLAAASLTGALGAAAVVVAVTTPDGLAGLRAADSAARRRLVGVLGVAAAVLASVTVGLVLDDSASGWMWLLFLAALVVAVPTAWAAPGVIPTLALAASLFGTYMATLERLGLLPEHWAAGLAMIGSGLIGSYFLVRWLQPPALVEALSIAVWLVGAGIALGEGTDWSGGTELAAGWVGRIGLLGLVAAGTVRYLRGGRWPWAAGAAVALPTWIAIEFADTLGAAVSMVVAGVLLVAVSVALTVARRAG